jgi:hypothetical protein
MQVLQTVLAAHTNGITILDVDPESLLPLIFTVLLVTLEGDPTGSAAPQDQCQTACLAAEGALAAGLLAHTISAVTADISILALCGQNLLLRLHGLLFNKQVRYSAPSLIRL